MSFRCECCGEPQAPRKRPNRVVVETRKVFEGHGYDRKMRTEIAKEEDRCDVCAVGTIAVGQGGEEQAFKSGLVTLGDRMQNGVFDAVMDPEIFTFKGQEGPVVGSQGTKLVPSES
jgi:hypothetical protein